jgi:hypothetical protein
MSRDRKSRDGSNGSEARGENNESVMPQKADVVGTLSHFRVGPKPDIGLSIFCNAGGPFFDVQSSSE